MIMTTFTYEVDFGELLFMNAPVTYFKKGICHVYQCYYWLLRFECNSKLSIFACLQFSSSSRL